MNDANRGRARTVRLAAALACAFAALLPVRAAAQANAIESVNSQRQGAETYVSVVLREAPKAAPGRLLRNSPPGVVLDFPDTGNATGRDRFEFAQGDVRDARIENANGGSRLTLDLKRPLLHTLRIEGRNLLVTFSPGDAPPTPAATLPQARAAAEDLPHALRDLDFRRGRDGSARIVVDLSDDQAAAEVQQRGSQLVVDLPGTRLPSNLRRSLDVTDFGTPVKAVRTTAYAGGTRIVVEPDGLWDYGAYQSGSQLVVEVRRIQDEGAVRPGQQGYRGERMSLSFQNIDIRSLLQVFADFTNLNIVASDSVSGNATLRLKDVPWDQALDIVLEQRGLEKRKTGNVLVIAPREEFEARDRAARDAAEVQAPLSEVFQLKYQKADVFAAQIMGGKAGDTSSPSSTGSSRSASAGPGGPTGSESSRGASVGGRILSRSGTAVADTRTNKLYVSDTPAKMEQVRALLAQFDVPVRQVLIEARVVQADDNFARNLGAKLGFNDNRSTYTTNVAVTDPATGRLVNMAVPVYGAGSQVGGSNVLATVGGNLTGVADLSSQNGSGLTGLAAPGIGIQTALANTNFVNLPAPAINQVTPGSFAISLFGAGLTRFLNLELSALEADTRGKVVSSPRVLTADNEPATIEQGTEVPFQVSTSSGATSIQFRKASLRLEVTPQITPDGNVLMRVQVNNDNLGILTPQGYSIDRREVQTRVVVENGGTVVIGGIYIQTERNTVNKVPLLGDIPVLGYLFKNNLAVNNRTEMLVFLTPRVVTESAVAR